MQQWGADRIEELTALVAAGAPDEDLTADELLTACFEQPGVVLGPSDGTAAVAVGVGRDASGELIASVRLLVVRPDRRGVGLGGSLLDAAERWASERGAERIEIGGALPFPLWPGADASTGLVHLAGARGYEPVREFGSLELPSSFRAQPPEGVVVRRAVRDEDVTAVTLAVAGGWSRLSDEVARALDHGTCHAAFAAPPTDREGLRGDVLGVGCHSVTRATWVGPLVVRPADRRRGIGHALLAQVCRDLMIADFRTAEVPDPADPGAEAFVVAAGATVSRRYVQVAKVLRR